MIKNTDEHGTYLRKLLARLDPAWLLFALAIGVAYYPAFQMDLIGYDLLNHLHIVRSYGPFAGFSRIDVVASLYTDCQCVYRPFFLLQTGILYQAFGFNHTGYQASLLVIHWAGCLVVYAALKKILGRSWLALLLALMFAAHPYLLDHVIWLTDTNLWLNLLAGILIILLWQPSSQVLWYMSVFIIVVTAPLLRENGLALPVGLLSYAAVGHLTHSLPLRTRRIFVIEALVAIGFYFALRAVIVGLLPSHLDEIYIELFGLSPAEQLSLSLWQRYAIYGYTVMIYVIGSFFPFFDYVGTIRPYAIAASAGFAMTVFVGRNIGLRWHDWCGPRRRLLVGTATIIVLAGCLLGLVIFQDHLQSELIQLPEIAGAGLQGVLSLGLLLFARSCFADWSFEEKGLGAFALSLIVVSSAVAFVYFRYRNLNLALMGWLVLFLLVWKHLPHKPGIYFIRWLTPVMLSMAIVFNIYTVNSRLPLGMWQVDNYMFTPLCHGLVDEDIAVDVGAYYGIPPSDIQACRAAYWLDIDQRK